MRGMAASDASANPTMMNRPATIEIRPTGTAPRRLIIVGTQMTPRATSQRARPSSGANQARYWLNRIG